MYDSKWSVMAIKDLTYNAAVIVAIAGVPAATFRAWRNRNGLFPEKKEASGWNRFFVSDIYSVKAMSELMKHGYTVTAAVNAANALRPFFDLKVQMLDREIELQAVWLLISRASDGEEITVERISNLRQIRHDSQPGILTWLDVHRVSSECDRELVELGVLGQEPEGVTHDLGSILRESTENVFGKKSEPEE